MIIIAPAGQASIRPHAARETEAGADLGEAALGGRRLTGIVTTPAGQRPVGSHAARETVSGTDLGEAPEGGVASPEGYRPSRPLLSALRPHAETSPALTWVKLPEGASPHLNRYYPSKSRPPSSSRRTRNSSRQR